MSKNEESNIIPLLKEEIEGDYEDLIKNKNQILTLIKDLNKEINEFDLINKKDESIIIMKEKFEELEKHMKKYSHGITHLKSYIQINKNKNIIINDNKKEENDFNSLFEFSNLISNQFENLNKKVINKFKSFEIIEDKKISKSYDIRKININDFQLKEKLNKNKEKRELQLLLDKNKKILNISNEIKKNCQNGNDLINYFDNNIIDGNEELEKSKNISFIYKNKYIFIGGGLIIIFFIICILIYVKYYSPKKNKI
jgi:hypothetical protein